MCGRFSLNIPLELLIEYFGLDLEHACDVDRRYNIAPTETVPVIRIEDGKRCLVHMKWGLVPEWADDPAIGNRLINARAETVDTKNSFRKAFFRRRCLVPAGGFFEWKKVGKGPKQPYFIHRKDGQPLAMAGLWERWEGMGENGEDEVLETFTIITTEANETVKPLHERMPAIIADPRYFDFWLDPEVKNKSGLKKLLAPCNSDLLKAYPVSRYVSKAGNKGEQCIELEGELSPCHEIFLVEDIGGGYLQDK